MYQCNLFANNFVSSFVLRFNLTGQFELRGGVSCYIYVYCQTIGLAYLEEAQFYIGRINVQNIFLHTILPFLEAADFLGCLKINGVLFP